MSIVPQSLTASSCYCSGLIKDVSFVLVTLGWQKLVEEEETSQSEDTDGKDVMKPFQRLGKSLEAPLYDLHNLPT